MCGIVGYDWNNEPLITKAVNELSHRGPDQTGVYADDSVSLGFARLAINDLSENANQPMTNEDGSILLVFNGEIYNFKSLKDELEKKGHTFVSKSDSEVVIHAYEEEGINCVRKFNGMWAFAIYDRNTNMLYLSRDRIGIKPMYYYYNKDNKRLIFANELKAIVKVMRDYVSYDDKYIIKGKTLEINQEALDLYLSLGYIPEPYSIYKDVYKLKKAHNMSFSLDSKTGMINRYWSLPKPQPIKSKIGNKPGKNATKNEIINQGRELLREIMKDMSIADVEIGTFLSGGVDSSLVTAMMKEFQPDLHTFSIGSNDPKYDESKYAEHCAKHLATKHHHYKFKERDFEYLFDRLYYYYDEPYADYSMFPTFMVSKLAKKYVKVCLSGDGGDELFGGYDHYKKIRQLKFLSIAPFKKTLSKLSLALGSEKLARALKMASSKNGAELIENYLSIGGKKNQLSPLAIKIFEDITRDEKNRLKAFMNYDFNYVLTDDYLTKVDRASMANSLEVRVPLLDHRFVEFANNIPLNYKVTSFGTKKIFKSMAEKYIPKQNIYRDKMGFGSPIVKWLFTRYNGLSIEKLENLKKRKLVDDTKIDECIKYLKLKKYNGLIGITVWRYIGLELWAERWF